MPTQQRCYTGHCGCGMRHCYHISKGLKSMKTLRGLLYSSQSRIRSLHPIISTVSHHTVDGATGELKGVTPLHPVLYLTMIKSQPEVGFLIFMVSCYTNKTKYDVNRTKTCVFCCPGTAARGPWGRVCNILPLTGPLRYTSKNCG